jgi:phosphatidylserine/phosphatidylglycerophosphate/cardiolipin synthase-like enzyme
MIKYGFTPNLEQGTILGGNALNPIIQISGVPASQVIYVQAQVQIGNAIELSDTLICMTASNSSGDIKVYFNRSVNTSYASSTENHAITLNNAIDDTLIAYINRAQHSIDIMIYNMDAQGPLLSDIAGALNQAFLNGRKIRVIRGQDASNNGISQLNLGIPVLIAPEPQFPTFGLMHNKIFIFDAFSNNPNRPIVWTGSTNLTPAQVNTDPNNVVIVQDQSLAIAFTMEFEEMWGSNSMTPNPAQARFGPQKRKNTPHVFNIGGRRVECYFSPSDGTNARILKAIGDATHDLAVNSMLITRTDLAEAIIQKHSEGVDVRILLHHPNEGGSSSQYNYIAAELDWRIMNYSAVGQGGKLHHKLMFANAFGGDNPYVLTGSHNWSTAAELRNDENTLVIYDADIVNQYLQEFMGRLGAVASAEYYQPFESLTIYPNPTCNKLNVSFVPEAGINKICVYDVSGKVLKQFDYDEISPLMQIDLENYPAGAYFLKIEAAGVSHVEKIILN